jgi:hypothetical protein
MHFLQIRSLDFVYLIGLLVHLRWLSSGLLRRVVWWKFTDVLEVLAASYFLCYEQLL